MEDLEPHSWAWELRAAWEVLVSETLAAVVWAIVVAGAAMALETWAVLATRAWVVSEGRRKAARVLEV